MTKKIVLKGKKSKWINDAEFRLKNRKWLRYSSNVARRVSAIIGEDRDLCQAALAKRLKVSPQHVSKILKGRENLTLETIANLSDALGVELITFPEYKHSVKQQSFWFALKNQTNNREGVVLHTCTKEIAHNLIDKMSHVAFAGAIHTGDEYTSNNIGSGISTLITAQEFNAASLTVIEPRVPKQISHEPVA